MMDRMHWTEKQYLTENTLEVLGQFEVYLEKLEQAEDQKRKKEEMKSKTSHQSSFHSSYKRPIRRNYPRRR